MSADLFEPFQLGDLTLANRMVMAPLTRNRAERDGTVPPLMATYYQQRASAGLVVTESTPVSPQGVGYPHIPGIYTEAQAASWDLVRAQTAIRGGAVNLVAFGVSFLANPDLVRSYRENPPLNEADPSTFHGGSEAGYTDYPFYRGEEGGEANI